jgi:hypothetical protein
MKQVGRCEQCSKAGVLEIVEVTEVGGSAGIVHLHLCSRCAVVPSAVWRRRYQPVAGAVARGRSDQAQTGRNVPS